MASLSIMAIKRLQKEQQKFEAGAAAEGLRLTVVSQTVWHVDFKGAAGTLYAGEPYKLLIEFGSDYPMDSPRVQFLGASPVHEHIYSCGHICLNILGDDWSPALTVNSVVLSVLSMLSSATRKERPHDDLTYSATHKNSNPKRTNFAYHDDSV